MCECLSAAPIPPGLLAIGQVAQLTGLRAKTIRYYEDGHLLPQARRGPNGYRRYSVADVNRIILLQCIRHLGVPLAVARPFLMRAADASCAEVQADLQRLLLVTDRQALLLRDYAPASAAGTQLGFPAHSWPLGRLVAVSAALAGGSLAQAIREWSARVLARLCAPLPFDAATAPPEQTTCLLLALEDHSGIQLIGLSFPLEAAESAQRAAALLRGFIPLLGDAGRGGWRLRRVPAVPAW